MVFVQIENRNIRMTFQKEFFLLQLGAAALVDLINIKEIIFCFYGLIAIQK